MGYKSKITDNERRSAIRTLKAYIGKYFHDDIYTYRSKEEPYTFYKHLIRKYLIDEIEVCERVRDVEKEVTGVRPDNSTIYHSRDKDLRYSRLTTKEITEALTFLNKHFHMTVQQVLKTEALKRLNSGYTKEDIARHCMVHKEVIDKLMEDKDLPEPTIALMERHLL